MFGYIAPALNLLSDDLQKRYRACYCGLCRELQAISGGSGRLTLSNDMTFLGMLLQSLYEPDETIQTGRCLLHPLKKSEKTLSGMSSYAAEMNLLLMYYKLADNIRDERSPAAKIGMSRIRKPFLEIEKSHPDTCRAVGEILMEINNLEDEAATRGIREEDLDHICNLSGKMLAITFVPDPNDVWAQTLFRIGEGLGRFVCFMDAYEDYDRDRKKGHFNPLIPFHDRPDYESFCKDSMEMLIAEATEAFEYLPLEKDLEILRNVMYSGIWQRYVFLQDQKEKEKLNVK